MTPLMPFANLVETLAYLNLGLMTKARGCKVAGQDRKLRSERKCEGMNPHTPKGAFTLGVGILVDF
jgi:hypothetical protein